MQATRWRARLDSRLADRRSSRQRVPSPAGDGTCHPLSPRLPVTGTSARVRHGDDHHTVRFNSVDDAERKTPQQVSTGTVLKRRPCLWEPSDCRFRSVHFLAEGRRRRGTALRVPACGSFRLLERFPEVLKFAGHGRLPRECVGAPPTRAASGRCLRRADQVDRESRLTTPLRRPRRPRSRDSESALRRVRPVLRRRVGALRLGALWHPWQQINSSMTLDGLLDEGPLSGSQLNVHRAILRRYCSQGGPLYGPRSA